MPTDGRGDPPALVVVCGLPGAGKTTVAEAIADRTDGELLRTDVVRKDMYPEPEYTDAEDRAVYEELLSRARDAVGDGRTAVLDGTFRTSAHRDRAVRAAEAAGVHWRFVRVECDQAVVEDRIRQREGDESDADVEVHRMFREQFEPIDREHVTIDNSGTVAATTEQVEQHF